VKEPQTIQSGLKAANRIGFLEGYNQALSDMMIAMLKPKQNIGFIDELKEKFSAHYEEIMGEKVPGSKL